MFISRLDSRVQRRRFRPVDQPVPRSRPLRARYGSSPDRIIPTARQTPAVCGLDVFFADPHSPWQRPTNENGNGLLRRYLGKGTDLNRFTNGDLRVIAHRLNTMPRRVLGWSSANNVYDHAVALIP